MIARHLGQPGNITNDYLQLRQIMASLRRWKRAERVTTWACTAQLYYKAKLNHMSKDARYDMDSKVIRIDNCASYSVSFDRSDFVSELKPIKHRVKGLGGTLADVKTGTIKWRIEDDGGQDYTLTLP